jgi:hypothetical protein
MEYAISVSVDIQIVCLALAASMYVCEALRICVFDEACEVLCGRSKAWLYSVSAAESDC